jgi:hypothetical protein
MSGMSFAAAVSQSVSFAGKSSSAAGDGWLAAAQTLHFVTAQAAVTFLQASNFIQHMRPASKRFL